MTSTLVVFSSSTTANRLKRLAASEQLHGVGLMQAPGAISRNGCTYALRCPADVLPALLALAERYNIKHGFVYRELTDYEGRKFYQQI